MLPFQVHANYLTWSIDFDYKLEYHFYLIVTSDRINTNQLNIANWGIESVFLLWYETYIRKLQ